MSEGWGLGFYGLIEPWGSAPKAAPPVERQLGPFNFQCRAKIEGYSIEYKFTAPSFSESPEWSRAIRILRKQGEWPQEWDDPGAVLLVEDSFPIDGEYIFEDTGLDSGTIYYYALFSQRTDGTWIKDRFLGRCSAYPYDRWGAVDYMYSSLPRGYRAEDQTTQNLYQFITLLGALVDNTKTDIENLLTLFEIESVHDDLLYLIDRKLGWPTWYATGGLQRRLETRRAVDLFKLIGRVDAYEQMLEEISDWDLEVVEGWKYVMWSNNRFGATTPDFTDPDIPRLMGRIDDHLRYTPDTEGWHSVTGLGFFLYEIPGISGELTLDVIDRIEELIEWGKASFVTISIKVVPLSEEYVYLFKFLDEHADSEFIYDGMAAPIEEDLGYTTSSWSLFTSTDSGSTSTTLDDRTFHSEIDYI